MNIPRLNLPRVVIVGGGFAGLTAAKRLKKSGVQVIMIDKNNYHTSSVGRNKDPEFKL